MMSAVGFAKANAVKRHAEIAELRCRLGEAEDALAALRSGAADALLGETGVFYLTAADRPRVAALRANAAAGTLDVTPERVGQLRLAASVFESTLEGVMITDVEGTILSVNPAFGEITGFCAEEAVGAKPNLLRSQRHTDAFYEDIWRTLRDTGRWRGEIWNRRKSGELYLQWTRINLVAARDGQPACYVAVFADITEMWRKDERIAHLAYHDPLTDLPNRALLMDRLAHALTVAERQGGRVGVLFVDLDGFKNVNDNLGHPVGDQVLQAVAARLTACVRSSDTVARLGGDEFVVLMENLSGVEECAVLAEKLLAALSWEIEGGDVRVGASIGIAVYPDDGRAAAALLQQADAALYVVKAAGKGRFRFRSPRMGV